MLELYNLHTDDSSYRITKFIDGNVEASYLLTEDTCTCPAGQRPLCRHRQMFPQMLGLGILNTQWFFRRDFGCACDINGEPRSVQETSQDIVTVPEGQHDVQDTTPAPTPEQTIQVRTSPALMRIWRRL